MTSEKLLHILEDLNNEEFNKFKWFLQQPGSLDDRPLKTSRLEHASRCDTVDVMVQTYGPSGAVEVTLKVLEKISRNDMVQSLSDSRSEPGGSGTSGQTLPGPVTEERKLFNVRTHFIGRVSDSVLNGLLDRLLEKGVINSREMESMLDKPREHKARKLIDMVLGKGDTACEILIDALCELDPFLSKKLKLK